MYMVALHRFLHEHLMSSWHAFDATSVVSQRGIHFPLLRLQPQSDGDGRSSIGEVRLPHTYPACSPALNVCWVKASRVGEILLMCVTDFLVNIFFLAMLIEVSLLVLSYIKMMMRWIICISSSETSAGAWNSFTNVAVYSFRKLIPCFPGTRFWFEVEGWGRIATRNGVKEWNSQGFLWSYGVGNIMSCYVGERFPFAISNPYLDV